MKEYIELKLQVSGAEDTVGYGVMHKFTEDELEQAGQSLGERLSKSIASIIRLAESRQGTERLKGAMISKYPSLDSCKIEITVERKVEKEEIEDPKLYNLGKDPYANGEGSISDIKIYKKEKE